MKTIIHVLQAAIKRNKKTGSRDPVLTCKTYKDTKHAYEADILDKKGEVVASVVYRPDKPLPCGGQIWIESHNTVRVKTKFK